MANIRISLVTYDGGNHMMQGRAMARPVTNGQLDDLANNVQHDFISGNLVMYDADNRRIVVGKMLAQRSIIKLEWERDDEKAG